MTRSPNGDLRTCVYHPPLEGTYSNIIDAFQSDEMEKNIRQEMRDVKKDLNVSGVISMMNQINILADRI